MPRHPRRATLLALSAAAVPLSLPLPPATAADLTWSTPTSGRWLDPTRWSTSTLPTTADTVTISTVGSYTVTLDSSSFQAVQVGPVTLNAPDATLSFSNAAAYSHSLFFYPTALTISAGTLAVHSSGSGLNIYATSFSNAGTVFLDADSAPSATYGVFGLDTGSGNATNTGTIEAHAAPVPPPPSYNFITAYAFTGSTGKTFTNTGTLRTVGGASIELYRYTLNQNAGSLDGEVELYDGTLNYNGGSCSTAIPVYLSNSTLKIAPTATAGNFSLGPGSTISGNISAGNTVRTTSAYAPFRWTGTSSTHTNAGRLIVGYLPYLPSSSSPYPSLDLGSSSTLLNTGTLELNSPNLPAAVVTGSITNQGAVAVHAPNPTVSGQIARVYGSFTQNAGGSLTIDPATSLTFANPLYSDPNSPFDFYFNGGTVNGSVALNNITAHFAPGLANTGSGTFTYSTNIVTNSSTRAADPFTGDIPSGATFVQTAGNATTTFYFSPFTNAGTLATSRSSADIRTVYRINDGSHYPYTYTGTLANTGSLGGTVNGVDRGIDLELDGTLTNTGAIKAYNLTVYKAVFNQNAGTLDVNYKCTASQGTFNYNGGTLTGNSVGIQNGTLNIAPGTNPASFIFYSGHSTFHGNITPGSTLALDSGATVIADPFTNAGTLRMAPSYYSTGSTLTIPNNGTLTNTGTLSIGAGATLTLTGSLSTTTPLDLQGTLDLRGGPLTWSYTPATPSPADTLRSLLLTSHLTNSTADATHRLAYSFSAEPTAPPSLLVSLALTGDTNLDGSITPDDYALLDRSYARSLSNAHWTDGDFNYDGLLDQQDYLLIDTTYAQSHPLSPSFLSQRDSQFGPAYVSTLLASVPEPTSLLAACGLALPYLRRRRTLKIRRTFQ